MNGMDLKKEYAAPRAVIIEVVMKQNVLYSSIELPEDEGM